MTGRPSHKPTKETRQKVREHSMVGTPQELIADILNIDEKTLRKHYREELDHGLAEANARACGILYRNVTKGDPASVFFWLKTRAGFKETNVVQNENKKVKKFTDMYEDE
jgi:hypothetical protein